MRINEITYTCIDDTKDPWIQWAIFNFKGQDYHITTIQNGDGSVDDQRTKEKIWDVIESSLEDWSETI